MSAVAAFFLFQKRIPCPKIIKNLYPSLLYYFLKTLIHYPLFSIEYSKRDSNIYPILFYCLKQAKRPKKNARGAQKQKKCPETVFRVPEMVFRVSEMVFRVSETVI
jgi:hypothetical protein